MRRSLALGLVGALGLVTAAPVLAATPAPPPQAASTHDDALKGARDLARRAALLVALGGFGAPGRDGLATAVNGLGLVPSGDRGAQLAALDGAVGDSAADMAALSADGVRPSLEMPQAVGQLSAADRSALAAGRPISAPAQAYLYVLDDLLSRDGRPPLDGRASAPPPDPAAIHAGLSRLIAPPASTPPASAAPSPTEAVQAPAAGEFPLPLTGGVIALVLLLVGVGIYALTRRDAPRPPAAPIEELLEISRRLTSARSLDEVQRATVREALTLVPASSAALVVRGAKGLEVAHEGKDSILVPEHLGEGIIGRVADTGQPMVQVSATEPAIRNLPVALAAVPLVGGGSVIAVLVLARGESQPFRLQERSLLMALAPVAAAAIASAEHASGAVEESLTDPLTGIGNRRRFEADLAGALESAESAPTSLVMLDIDHFKAINDTHGHPTGDDVLRAIGRLLSGEARPGERVYRYGGEEFCAILPATSTTAAAEFAERVRAAIENLVIPLPRGGELRATASVGVAEAAGRSIQALVDRADAALYRAKQAGRNRVVADNS